MVYAFQSKHFRQICAHSANRRGKFGNSDGGERDHQPSKFIFWHVAAVAANYESVVVAFRLLSFVCNIQMHLADNLLLC